MSWAALFISVNYATHTHRRVCVCERERVCRYYLLDAADLVESGPLALVLEH